MSQCKYPGAGSPLCNDKPHCPAAQNSYTVHSPPSTLKYANTVTIGISGQIGKHCPVLAGNSLQGSAASCRTHGLTIQQKARRVSTSYLGKNNFLIPSSLLFEAEFLLLALCSPPGVQTAHQLPPSSPFASNTSHLLTHSHRQGQSEDIINYLHAK